MIEPCPFCEIPPCIVEDAGAKAYSVGCRQAFFRRNPDDPECVKRPSVMAFDDKPTAVRAWNDWCKARKLKEES